MQQKILIGLALTLVIVIFIAVYWATEGGRQEAARDRLRAEAVERGGELYALQCAGCHGSGGQGGTGAALRDTSLEENALEKIIARGIPGTAMPAFDAEDGGPLKGHEVEDLVTFIKNWEEATLREPEAGPETAPSGIVAEELYGASCEACHGAVRQGVSGLAPALTPDSLAASSDADIRDAIADGVPGTAMPPFKGRLTSDEIDALLQLIKGVLP